MRDLPRLLSTLGMVYSEELGSSVRFEPWQRGGTRQAQQQIWGEVPLLGGLCVPRASARVRRYLADHFRYTRSRWRQVPQFAAGSLLGTRWVFASLDRPRAISSLALPNAADRLILPGSRRVRTFDFVRGRTRVHVLSGCSPASTLREIELRGQDHLSSKQVGPFPRLLEWDTPLGWYEEEILDGWCLARLPPWFDRARLLQQALSELDRFAAPSGSEVAAHTWADERRTWLAEQQQRLAGQPQLAEQQPRPGPSLPRAILDCLAELASEGRSLRVKLAHGDLQEGNLFALRQGGVLILDWEFSHLSFAEYDRLVLGLWMRSGGNILERLRAFVHGENAHPALGGLPCGYPERRRLVARLLLEELRFFLIESEARDDGYSQGLGAVFQAAKGFADAVMQERF